MAVKRGFRFGRKVVDSAIRQSDIHLDAAPMFEASEVRKAFGVYGRHPHLDKNPIAMANRAAKPIDCVDENGFGTSCIVCDSADASTKRFYQLVVQGKANDR